MRSPFSQHSSDELEFELFSNVTLKFTAILVVVMVLLAINVGQKLDMIISPSRFSGGIARPQVYIGAWQLQNPNRYQRVSIHLFSPSLAQAATQVQNGKLISTVEGQTFAGAYGGSVRGVLWLLAGIDPGTLLIDGKPSPFVVPNFSEKNLVETDERSKGTPPSNSLALAFLRLWSDAYRNSVFPIRSSADFKKSSTKIYIESHTEKDQHGIVLGNLILPLSGVEKGNFDFLTALSSTNTEVVYLGELERDDEHKTTTRISFFESNGYPEVAKHLRAATFPSREELGDAAADYASLPTWAQLSASDQTKWVEAERGDVNTAQRRYDNSRVNAALDIRRNKLLEEAMINDEKPKTSVLPTILAYPEAWQAYVAYRLRSNPVPPSWLVEGFLRPLGFDKRVVLLPDK